MRLRTLSIAAALVLMLAACGNGTNTLGATVAPPIVLLLSTATPTATPEPTGTPVPLAARVNGQPIALDALVRELARFEAGQAALGQDLAALGDYRARVLDDLIDRELVAQAAAREGIQVSGSDLEARYQSLVTAAGGPEAFAAWLAANLYSDDEYRGTLRTAMIAEALAGKVAPVSETAEQVHARHILVATEGEAEDLLARIRGGRDLGDLARQFSQDLSTRINGGELGWFARGQLAVPEVEDAAFNLQPNEVSGVVHSAYGFHVIQTLERDPARPLDPAFYAALRQKAFDAWLAGERAQAAIEILAK